MCKPVNRRAQQGGVDGDDVDRHVAEQIGKAPLRRERPHKGAVLQQRHHPRRHPPGDIKPAGGHHLQSEIAGFSAPYVDDDAQGRRG